MKNGRGWEEFLIPYEQAVDELKIKFRAIRSELKKRNNYSPIEFVVGRVKKVSSILSKASKLNIPLDRIDQEMEDIAGIRIMCQFVDDIEKVVDLIRQRDGKDLRIVTTKDYITNKKESGYRSYHVIIYYPVQTARGEKEILAEIQIRTLAMNFWATIEHSLNYKYEQNIPEHIKSKLRRAAEAAFQLDQEMSDIRDEIMSAQKSFEQKSSLVSHILHNIESLFLQGAVVEANDYQERFNHLIKIGDILQLRQLSREIEHELNRRESSFSYHKIED